MIFLKNLLKGVGLATLSFNRYKTAQSVLGKSCILCFETVLGMKKITSNPSPPPLISQKLKNFQKLSFNRCKIAHTLLRRSCTLCFETVFGMNKIKKKIPNNFSKFFFYDIFKKFV